jgi:GMP synthase (glutamine-hydrolysing)
MIAVLDYGSQYTQLIAKQLRRLGYKTEVWPATSSAAFVREQINARDLRALVLSGSPASVGENIQPDPGLLELGLPILGICFGYHFLAHRFGGKVVSSEHREYGAAVVSKAPAASSDPLLKGLPADFRVWMSHGDSVVELPKGAELLLQSQGKIAAFSIPAKKIWALQFHPEVHHSECGTEILTAFAREVASSQEDWSVQKALDGCLAKLRKDLDGVPEVLCAVSGGVDSTVLAALLSQVTKVHAVFVDHGFQRAYDLSDLKRVFGHFPNIRLDVVDARKEFWAELDGVSDPETKRKIIGRLFIETFDKHADCPFLGQGTIYSDVIESAAAGAGASHNIKSHHNVGGLPKDIKFKLVEPLREFFKDEVREIGRLLGIDAESLNRHPFPGPGLSIRCVGPLKPERIEVLRKADAIFHEELVKRNLYHKTWQALCVLTPISTVGVMGDGRTYESVLAIRAVSSIDAMTAEASELPFGDLKAIASRIINEVKGVSRVVYDLTSKPPGTIEWE